MDKCCIRSSDTSATFSAPGCKREKERTCTFVPSSSRLVRNAPKFGMVMRGSEVSYPINSLHVVYDFPIKRSAKSMLDSFGRSIRLV
ncbi:hypothetical protein NPIL_353211 [Nephila pilipes]|uniref:Uncharacterized protein n=1 Tax=Nephila pilipes TaxID=299642 RepID=A0A8X6QJX6_NEPPI|nr:hypothetical protein NPIL_353211 [Nephila pilipes]